MTLFAIANMFNKPTTTSKDELLTIRVKSLAYELQLKQTLDLNLC